MFRRNVTQSLKSFIKVKMPLGLLFLFLISISFAVPNEVCSILSICDDISAIRSQVAAIRDEQARQANILEGSALPLESASGLNVETTKNNEEFCTLLSICNNLAALSLELADVRAEQERQTDLLEKSCKTETASYPANCYEALKDSQKSGVTEIRVPEYSENPFKVACDQESHDGGWTVILRRINGSEDFFREWKDYEEGFGKVDGEYFVGLGPLHALTSSARQELLVIVEDNENPGERYTLYDNFRVGGEANNYTLESVGNWSGTALDALSFHLGMQFSTKDRDNDVIERVHCAKVLEGAWWFSYCYLSNLTGRYDHEFVAGPFRWNTYKYDKPLKTAVMMIRPKASALLG